MRKLIGGAAVLVFSLSMISLGSDQYKLLTREDGVNPNENMPNVFLVTIPKSASKYMSSMIATGLGYREMFIKLFEQDSLPAVSAVGGRVIKSHMYPTKENLQMLREHTDGKIVVHVRDLRAVNLSGVHHNLKNREKVKLAIQNGASGVDKSDWYSWFVSLSLEEQIDHYIEERLPKRTRWVQEWLIAIEQEKNREDGLDILLTTYDDLLEDEEKLFNNIVKHFGIAKSKFNFTPIVKDESVNYRKGDKDEWRRVYTPEQMAKINKIVPRELLDRFNWAY